MGELSEATTRELERKEASFANIKFEHSQTWEKTTTTQPPHEAKNRLMAVFAVKTPDEGLRQAGPSRHAWPKKQQIRAVTQWEAVGPQG